ncbi:hypothetical protein FACS189443_5610 [Planctomycetales bacterium]|nr:hypothetical protein FACS189443_5610 [Planctomycetales bacterium]
MQITNKPIAGLIIFAVGMTLPVFTLFAQSFSQDDEGIAQSRPRLLNRDQNQDRQDQGWRASREQGREANRESRLQNGQNTQSRQTAPTQATAPLPSIQLEMRESLKKLPWDEISAVDKLKIKRIVSKSPVFRKMPKQTIYADPEMYLFLLEHPDIVVSFWQHFGATQMKLKEKSKGKYYLEETAGTKANIEVLYQSPALCVAYAKGEYRGPFFARPCSGEVLLILRSKAVRDIGNEPMLECELDSFVAIDNFGADMLAKLFFQSLGKIADDNFEQTVMFVSQVSRAAQRNPEGVKETAGQIKTIRQDVLGDFCDVVDHMSIRVARRNNSVAMQRNTKLPDTETNTNPTQPGIVTPKKNKPVFVENVANPRQDLSVSHHEFLTEPLNVNARVFEADPFFASDFETVRQTRSKTATGVKSKYPEYAENEPQPRRISVAPTELVETTVPTEFVEIANEKSQSSTTPSVPLPNGELDFDNLLPD